MIKTCLHHFNNKANLQGIYESPCILADSYNDFILDGGFDCYQYDVEIITEMKFIESLLSAYENIVFLELLKDNVFTPKDCSNYYYNFKTIN